MSRVGIVNRCIYELLCREGAEADLVGCPGEQIFTVREANANTGMG
jgi:hypothetical protein